LTPDIIDVPPDVVFTYVSDVSNDVHWRSGVAESGRRRNRSDVDRLGGILEAGTATRDAPSHEDASPTGHD